ncbi:HemY domain-containing protein [Stappia sp. 22II-S9-Z10]|nr:HemY domain-containing protein [Stappia sp. 22II-S9-Z10]
MLRLLAFIALVGVTAAAAVWITERPGSVTLRWGESEAALSLGQALGLFAAAFLALTVAIEVVRGVLGAPRRMAARAEERRRARTLAALRDGLIAVAAGNTAAATRAATEAEKAAPGVPLATLLAAQAAQMRGDRATAEDRFRAMTASPETLIVGLRGLTLEAARAGDTEAERAHARAANAAEPSLSWAAAAAFHAATAERRFAEALRLNDEALRYKFVDRPRWKRRKAVLLTALAAEAETPDEARRHAIAAHGLASDLVPAAVLAARLLAPKSPRRALAVVEACYRAAPHPDLFAAALAIGDAQGAAARLKRAEALAALRPDHVESALGLAAAASAAWEFARARAALGPFLSGRPSQRVCIAIAEIEALEDGSEGAVREWLARAVRAPRDPAWIADGVVYETWEPISPVIGTLDAFAWRLPDGAEAPSGPAIDLTALTRALPSSASAAAPAPIASERADAPRALAPPAVPPDAASAEGGAPSRPGDPREAPRPSVPRAASPSPS